MDQSNFLDGAHFVAVLISLCVFAAACALVNVAVRGVRLLPGIRDCRSNDGDLFRELYEATDRGIDD